MKKLFVGMLMLFLITSCATLYKIDSTEIFYGIDFTRFAEKDFLFSTEKYTNKHLLIGIVDYKLYSTGTYSGTLYEKQVSSLITGESETYLSTTNKRWKFEEPDIDVALDSIYNICKALNGNAFIDLKFSDINGVVNKKNGKKITNPAIVPGIEISGNIIKRID